LAGGARWRWVGAGRCGVRGAGGVGGGAERGRDGWPHGRHVVAGAACRAVPVDDGRGTLPIGRGWKFSASSFDCD
jgi:hypothetical protein